MKGGRNARELEIGIGTYVLDYSFLQLCVVITMHVTIYSFCM